MPLHGLILATDEFEDSELSYPYYGLQETGWTVDVATPDGEAIEGKHGYEFEANVAISDLEPSAAPEEYDALVIPGGTRRRRCGRPRRRRPTSSPRSTRPANPSSPSATAPSC